MHADSVDAGWAVINEGGRYDSLDRPYVASEPAITTVQVCVPQLRVITLEPCWAPKRRTDFVGARCAPTGSDSRAPDHLATSTTAEHLLIP